MSKRLSSDEIIEMLAAYALRSLSPEEAGEVRRELKAMTQDQRNMLIDYQSVVGLLGTLILPVSPPEFLEDVIMDKIAEEAEGLTEKNLFSFVGIEEGEWQQLFDGIRMKVLNEDLAAGKRTALLEFKAGSILPRHRHLGREEVYGLQGYCTLNGQRLQAGDYLLAESGSIHEEVVFEVDCRIIAVLPDIEFLV